MNDWDPRDAEALEDQRKTARPVAFFGGLYQPSWRNSQNISGDQP